MSSETWLDQLPATVSWREIASAKKALAQASAQVQELERQNAQLEAELAGLEQEGHTLNVDLGMARYATFGICARFAFVPATPPPPQVPLTATEPPAEAPLVAVKGETKTEEAVPSPGPDSSVAKKDEEQLREVLPAIKEPDITPRREIAVIPRPRPAVLAKVSRPPPARRTAIVRPPPPRTLAVSVEKEQGGESESEDASPEPVRKSSSKRKGTRHATSTSRSRRKRQVRARRPEDGVKQAIEAATAPSPRQPLGKKTAAAGAPPPKVGAKTNPTDRRRAKRREQRLERNASRAKQQQQQQPDLRADDDNKDDKLVAECHQVASTPSECKMHRRIHVDSSLVASRADVLWFRLLYEHGTVMHTAQVFAKVLGRTLKVHLTLDKTVGAQLQHAALDGLFNRVVEMYSRLIIGFGWNAYTEKTVEATCATDWNEPGAHAPLRDLYCRLHLLMSEDDVLRVLLASHGCSYTARGTELQRCCGQLVVTQKTLMMACTTAHLALAECHKLLRCLECVAAQRRTLKTQPPKPNSLSTPNPLFNHLIAEAKAESLVAQYALDQFLAQHTSTENDDLATFRSVQERRHGALSVVRQGLENALYV